MNPGRLSIEERILFEDNHLLIVNKACSELVQGDKTGDPSLLEQLKAFIKVRDAKPGNVFLGLVHRLDRPSSGAVIYAKTSKALSRMSAAFQDRSVEKIYLALTEKPQTARELDLELPAGVLEDCLAKTEATNSSRVLAPNSKDGKLARLSYSLLEELDSYYLWKITLETGRHHQIRVQFSSRGLPIRGDLKYRAKRSIPGGGIGLHAWKLVFQHPTRDEMVRITAPPQFAQSDRLWQSVAALVEKL